MMAFLGGRKGKIVPLLMLGAPSVICSMGERHDQGRDE